MQKTSEEVLQRTLAEERSKSKEMLEIQRSEAMRSLEEEQKRQQETLQTELERERQKSKVNVTFQNNEQQINC